MVFKCVISRVYFPGWSQICCCVTALGQWSWLKIPRETSVQRIMRKWDSEVWRRKDLWRFCWRTIHWVTITSSHHHWCHPLHYTLDRWFHLTFRFYCDVSVSFSSVVVIESIFNLSVRCGEVEHIQSEVSTAVHVQDTCVESLIGWVFSLFFHKATLVVNKHL